jgi:hypothetical protein
MHLPKRWNILISLLWLGLAAFPAAAHRSGCHAAHSCPSDRGTYVCGDRGNCSECPDNAYCFGRQPRRNWAPPPTAQTPPAVHQERFSGLVVGLTDGDTLDVMRQGKAVRVRLWGIDTPERVQAFGTRARRLRASWHFSRP